MRKEAGFEVTDHIRVGYSAGKVGAVIAADTELKKDVLAESVEEGTFGYSKSWDIGGEKITLSVEKL